MYEVHGYRSKLLTCLPSEYDRSPLKFINEKNTRVLANKILQKNLNPQKHNINTTKEEQQTRKHIRNPFDN